MFDSLLVMVLFIGTMVGTVYLIDRFWPRRRG